jgi:hypothetical protein
MIANNDFAWHKGLPLIYRDLPTATLEQLERTRESSRTLRRRDTDETTTTRQTIWNRNNIHPSPVLHDNFSKSGVIEGLRAHMRRISDRQIRMLIDQASEGNETEAWRSVRPIAADMMFFGGDGSPIVAHAALAAVEGVDDENNADEDSQQQASPLVEIKALAGPFHMYMDDFKKTNRLYTDILQALLAPVYNGDLQKLHIRFLNFADPTIPIKILSSTLLAIDQQLLRAMKVVASQVRFSPRGMLDYILEVCKLDSRAMFLYQMRIQYSITLEAFRTVRQNDLPAYMGNLRFVAMKCAVTHSTNYMRIVCDALSDWYVRSPLDDYLLRKLFTGLSENGVHIARDLIHEKAQRAIRGVCGHVERHGHDATMEWASLFFTELASNQKGMERLRAGAYRTENRTRNFVFDAKYYAYATVKLDTLGVFRRPPQSSGSLPSFVNPDILLPTEVLAFTSESQRRVASYGIAFNVASQNIATRSEKDMGIKSFASKMEDYKKLEKRVTSLVTAQGKTAIDKSGKKAELLAEIKKFERYDGIEVPNISMSMSKKIIVQEVSNLRSKVFSKFPNAKKELLEEALAQLPSTAITQEQREQELALPFYFWTEDARNKPEYQEVHVVPEIL